MATAAWQKAWLPLSLAAFFVCAAYPIHNPDVFWHLGVGRAQWEQGAPLRVEAFAAPGPGPASEPLPWLGFEWLSELFYYLLWASSGAVGLVVFKALMAAATGLACERGLAWRGVPPGWRAAALLAAAWVSQTRWMVEPEIFTFLFLSVLIAFLRSSPHPFSPRNRILAAVLFAVWANLHGGFMYGLAVYGAHLVFSDESHRDKAVALAMAGLATLANPYGWRVYEVPVFLLSTIGQLRAANIEWRSPALMPRSGLPAFAVVALGGLAAASRRRGREADLAGLSCLALFGLWGVLSYRNLSVAAIVCAPLAVGYASDALKGAWLRVPWGGAVLATGVALGWLALAKNALALGPSLLGVAWSFYPRGVTEAIAASPMSGTVLMPPHWAGYAAWRLYPQRRTFAYGRLDVFRERLAELAGAKRGPEVWKAFLDRYGIEAAVEPHPGFYFQGELVDSRGKNTARLPRSPLAAYLPRESWALVYWDDQALLFVRRGSRVSQEYRLLDPTDLPYLNVLKNRGWLDRGLLAAERLRHEREAGPSRFDSAFDSLAR